MLKSWYENYEILMRKTSFISKLGALIVIVVTLFELFQSIKWIVSSEQVGIGTWSLLMFFVFPFIYLFLFGLRFVIFFRQNTYWLIAITGISAAILIYVHLSVFYSAGLMNPFNEPLLIVGSLFFLLGGIRFVITALAAIASHTESS